MNLRDMVCSHRSTLDDGVGVRAQAWDLYVFHVYAVRPWSDALWSWLVAGE